MNLLRVGSRGRFAMPRLGVRRVAVTVMLAMAVGATSALASSHEPGTETVTVAVQDFAFTPVRVTVPAGGTIVWSVGNDPEQHTVTPTAPGAFQPSGQLFDGDEYTLRFDTPGTYDYVCSLHPFMTGSVVVSAAAASATRAPAPSPPAPVSPVPSAPASASPAPTVPAVAEGGPLPVILGGGLVVVVLIGSAIAWARVLRRPRG